MARKKVRVLIVDQPRRRTEYAASLNALQPCELVFADDTDEALAKLAETDFDCAIAALEPPAIDGLDLLRRLRQCDRELPVVLVADEATVETATASLRLGAGDYLTRPLVESQVAASLDRLLQRHRIGAEHELLRRQVERPYAFDDIIGTSPEMQRVYETIEQVADSEVDVLVVGETGTGKELVARSLHRRSRRASKPFVPVDCGAIPESLLEAEFFGHERGAFTGANEQRIGLLEFADEGTFFLDELGELPLMMQAKLLRTLQERKIRRVGGRNEIDVDVRVVAATARDLDIMIRDGQFRKDLFYRINVVRIDLPPLRNRGDDIGLLAEHFATRHSRETQKNLVGITPEAYQVLAQYPWPGNVRELQNVVRRAIALARGTMIGLGDLPDALIAEAGSKHDGAGNGGESSGRTYFQLRDEHLARFETQYLTDVLTRHRGDIKLAAQEAGLPRGTLYRLMKNRGLDGSQFRSDRS